MNENRDMSTKNQIQIRVTPRDCNTVSLETKRRLVYFATRAPSGHNSQPWKFRFHENTIEIHPDFDRSLSVVDPNHRELFISLGCAAENMLITASHFNLKAELSICCESKEPFLSVSFDFDGSHSEDELFPLIEGRQTNRHVYDGRSLTLNQLDWLQKVDLCEGVSVDFFERGCLRFEKIKGRITAANEIQMGDNEFKSELLDWIRFNRTQVARHQDGLAHSVMEAPSMPEFIGAMDHGAVTQPKKTGCIRSEKN